VGTAALTVDLFYTPDEARAALHAWRDLVGDAPRQATFTAWVGTSADWPFLEPELRDRPMASVGYVWVGDPEEGRKLVPSLRDMAPPAAERIQELSYLELQSIEDVQQRQRLRRYWKGHYLRELRDEAIDAFLSRGAPEADAPQLVALPYAGLQTYGGAIADVTDDETAFVHRNALVEFVAVAGWTDPTEDETRVSAARCFGAAIEPFASGIYVNDLADEGEEGVRRAYGSDKIARLTDLKDRYDPQNVFHLNHNIRPSKDAG
jgi:FAD/FMN-containing dehydrogenase